ncbi:SusC/RagA family TonB-linked outer membrane protein [Ascidiimonas sp. W6]|uniref:SusC/RagA family TonB-linked outer membrane protein n=1 Tax=Ascidiimonas meishanensis TaxID=3128903 RepID=UPI0030ED21DE
MKDNLLKSLIILGTFLCFGMTQAQTVSGTVSDANGPLPGASVVVKGTTNGTQSDFDGNYKLDNVGGSAVLVFSYVGYATQEVTVNGRSTINITLQEDAQALDEIVVIGYGTQKIKDATGSVSVVSSKDFNTGVIASPEELIQGKTAGVQITSSSGEPGAGINIRIRGTSSIRSNNNPLFVVDGVPLAPEDTSGAGANVGFGSSAPKNPLNFLNPNDIESISILKDASATAIYGSRGANGVVLITTKGGKGTGGRFEFDSSVSFSSPANEFDLLGREQFLDAVEQFGGNRSDQDFGADTDWQSVVTRAAVSQNQNLAYSHGYDTGSVRATFGYGKQFGIIENSSLERITGRLNWVQRLFEDKLKLNLQASISRVNDERAPVSGSAGFRGDILGAAYTANPTWPNDPTFDTGGQINPNILLNEVQTLSFTDRVLLNFSGEYKITDQLTGKLSLGYDRSKATSSSVASSLARNLDNSVFGNGRGAVSDVNVENRLLEATLNYTKEFENSKLEALVGYSYQDFQRFGRNIQGFGFGTTDLNTMVTDLTRSAESVENLIDGRYQQYGYDARSSNAFVNRLFSPTGPTTDQVALGSGVNVNSLWGDTFDATDELQSFFGRVNYTIADKYIFTATVRADGSSRFGSDNQYGIFPSGAFAWKLDEEDFIGESFSTLKLRLGFGITGSQDGLGYGQFVRRDRYAQPNIQDNGNIDPPGTTSVGFANPNLKWEETTQYNLGIDFGFGNDRFTGTVDVYRKETTDFLLRINAAQPSPNTFVFQNLDATVVNQGVEFALNYDIFQTEDFNWNVGFNIAYNENEIQDFAGEIPAGTIRGQGLTGAFAQILADGQPLFAYFLREFEGFDANGQPIGDVQGFVDKGALPDFNTGLSTSISYKNWDFSAFLAGQFGHYIYNNTKNAFFTAGGINNARNVTPDVLTSGEAGTAEAAVSTRFLESGDFIRLQNATLGYTVPLSGEGTFKTLRLFVNGQNLFVITDYSGLDPEVSTQPGDADLLNGLPTTGIDYTSFPRPRTVTIGLNATF